MCTWERLQGHGVPTTSPHYAKAGLLFLLVLLFMRASTITQCGCLETSVIVNWTCFNWQRAGWTPFWLVVKIMFLRFQFDQECLLSFRFHTETPDESTHSLKWQQSAISVWWSSPVYPKLWVWEHLVLPLPGNGPLHWYGKRQTNTCDKELGKFLAYLSSSFMPGAFYWLSIIFGIYPLTYHYDLFFFLRCDQYSSIP